MGLLFLLATTHAYGKILYVNQSAPQFDFNFPPTCSKALPCNSPSWAVLGLAKGDTMRIYPGYYDLGNGGIQIDVDNVKIESVNGPRTTTLAAVQPYVIRVNANNVRIGRKGKGIKIASHFQDQNANTSLLNIFPSAIQNKVTVEGNIFEGRDFDRDGGFYNETDEAIRVSNVRNVVIKNNYITFTEFGITISNVDSLKATIRNNEFNRIQGACIDVSPNIPFGNTPYSNVTIIGNRLDRCRTDNDSVNSGIYGILVRNAKASIRDNAISRTPYAIGVWDTPSATIQRNTMHLGNWGIDIFGSDNTKVLDNVATDQEWALWGSGMNTTISGNHLHGVKSLEIGGLLPPIKITNNVLSRRGASDCVINPPLGTPLALKGNSYPGSAFVFDNNFPLPDLDDPLCFALSNEVQLGNITFDPKQIVFPKLKDKVPF